MSSAHIVGCGFDEKLSGVHVRPGDESSRANHDAPQIVLNQPAEVWAEALPVGNGRLGAMVHGGAVSERIGLNDDTFWSGAPGDVTVPSVVPQHRFRRPGVC